MKEKEERSVLQQYFKHTEDTEGYIKLGSSRCKNWKYKIMSQEAIMSALELRGG